MAVRKKSKGSLSQSVNSLSSLNNQPDDGAILQEPNPSATSASGFPVIGIGASAGGLAAFEAFFSGMPTDIDPGMAFVLVQHLAPDHKSILTELIRRYTRMEVFEVEDGMKVKPNCAYIIPPNRDMAFLNGVLHLMEPAAPRGLRLPIDFFFRSLAEDQHERAICIVLSGTGSDGTQGVRAVKGAGGMVMVQHPASTEYDGMPRSAIATGLVDYELQPSQMPSQLIAYIKYAFGRHHAASAPPLQKTEQTMKKICILLRSQVGHDFSQYKPNTIHRRIERRMAVHQIGRMEDYVKYLQQTPAEIEALFRDLLIGVTNFFRDAEAFDVLETEIIPKLFTGKSEDSIIRVWVPGCSTGEEAYSVAMLLAERMEELKYHGKIQVFATDIDSQAIATARAGVYSASCAQDIPPVRLARFFTFETDGSFYRINKGIRDMLIFSEQDVIKDPPFSRLDLICCRNLLIYLGGELQKKLIPLFHYALNSCGFLFLGTSETIGEFTSLFTTIDRKFKIYQRTEDAHASRHAVLDRFLPPPATLNCTNPQLAGRKLMQKKLPLRELTEETLLQQFTPAAALVNAQGDILYLHGRTGRYLEPSPGEAGLNNIIKMSREGLRRELTNALRKAAATKTAVHCAGLMVKTNGDFTPVNLTVSPVMIYSAVAAPEQFHYLVVLEELPENSHDKAAASLSSVVPNQKYQQEDADARIEILRRELRAKEEYLQSANEALETANEELKSSHEELQSINEELQSTNEELETSKEELQSINEELATVNAELQTKVTDLSRSNNDLNNLLAGTGIGTVFVDHQMHILRFTPAVTQIINLIQSDVGRPVGHILSNLQGYNRLVPDVRSVLDSLIPKEIEVQASAGLWYTMRILPYRTLDNVIEGAVITFVDITERKHAEAALRESENRFKQLSETLSSKNK